MMYRKYITLSVLSLVISLGFLSISIPSCEANYANWVMFSEGSSFHKGTHISMPYADVQINITRRATEVYLSLDSEFHVVTNTTQNATLAFVYTSSNVTESEYDIPPTTDSYYPYDESNFMRIYANGTNMDYTVIDYDDFKNLNFTEHQLYTYDYLNSFVSFAVFDLELTANTTMVLSTVTGEVFNYKMDQFSYSYIVGSARTFEGHTLERIHMRVIEELPFVSYHFYPNESLSISENGIVTDAIWDINVSEFSEGRVLFSSVAWNPDADMYNLIYSGAATFIIILLIYQFVFKKSKSGSV